MLGLFGQRRHDFRRAVHLVEFPHQRRLVNQRMGEPICQIDQRHFDDGGRQSDDWHRQRCFRGWLPEMDSGPDAVDSDQNLLDHSTKPYGLGISTSLSASMAKPVRVERCAITSGGNIWAATLRRVARPLVSVRHAPRCVGLGIRRLLYMMTAVGFGGALGFGPAFQFHGSSSSIRFAG